MASLLQELLESQRRSVDYFCKHLKMQEVDKLVQMLLKCSGVIFFTGVGKSALVAKKIAATMTSIGTKTLYLSPMDSLHGDLGMVGKDDLFVFLSKSGESDELLDLVPYLRNKGVTLVSLVSDPNSRLAKGCDFNVTLPLDQELCPFNLAPTTSSVVQMIFGNVLAIALMKLKEFPLEQYQINHPAGRIGKRLTLKVKDLMLSGKDIPLAKPQDKVVDVLVALSDKKCGCLLVVDEKGHLQGIFTDGDLRRSLQKDKSKALDYTLESLMTRQPRSIGPDVLAIEAMRLMEADQKRPVMVLPVLDEKGIVVGIIKMHDILQSGL